MTNPSGHLIFHPDGTEKLIKPKVDFGLAWQPLIQRVSIQCVAYNMLTRIFVECQIVCQTSHNVMQHTQTCFVCFIG